MKPFVAVFLCGALVGAVVHQLVLCPAHRLARNLARRLEMANKVNDVCGVLFEQALASHTHMLIRSIQEDRDAEVRRILDKARKRDCSSDTSEPS